MKWLVITVDQILNIRFLPKSCERGDAANLMYNKVIIPSDPYFQIKNMSVTFKIMAVLCDLFWGQLIIQNPKSPFITMDRVVCVVKIDIVSTSGKERKELATWLGEVNESFSLFNI